MPDEKHRRTVLITGGSGFVGEALREHLLASGWTVIATTTGDPRALPGDGWVRWDALDAPLPPVDWSTLDAVVHLAAPRDLSNSPAAAAALFEVTVGATFRLLQQTRLHGIRRILVASTGDVLGPGDEPALETDTRYLPASFYGAVKAAAEQIALPYARFSSVAVVRLFHPYGPGGDRFVVNRIARMVREGQTVAIEGENGIRLNPVWISDVAEGLRCAVESDACGIFHLAGPDTVSFRRMVEMMAAAAGRDVPIVSTASAAAGRHNARYTRAHELLGWRPTIGLADGIARLIGESV